MCVYKFAASSDVNNSNGCDVTVHFGRRTESKVPAGCEPLCVGRPGVSGGGGSFIPKKKSWPLADVSCIFSGLLTVFG